MRERETLKVGENGHLFIGGCDTVALAKKFGTPLYVMDEAYMRAVCRAFTSTIEKEYGNGLACFAGKSFLNMGMCKIIDQMGMGLDVVSGGELYTAVKAGFPMDKVYFHGANNSLAEMEMGLDHGVRAMVADSLYELDVLEDIAAKLGRKAPVSLRIKPDVSAHTHHYIQTGDKTAKFGLDRDREGLKAVRRVLQSKRLFLQGLHCHIGSQIFEVEPYELAVERMVDFAADVKQKLGYEIKEMNFGGGYGIYYTEEDKPQAPSVYVSRMLRHLQKCCALKGIAPPFFVIEPGRSIVGEAGITLYTVGTIKQNHCCTYLYVDGGMTDNIRPALYQAAYKGVLANKAAAPNQEVYEVSGKCCETGDMLIRGLPLPKAQPGDILAVFSTGAYNYAMANRYNRTPIPAVVLVKDGQAELLVRRETYDDLISCDQIPTWLA